MNAWLAWPTSIRDLSGSGPEYHDALMGTHLFLSSPAPRRPRQVQGAGQLGSRTVSAAVIRPRFRPHDLTSGTYTIASDRRPLVRRSPRRPRPRWSRPMPAGVCSMFARMLRYAPATSGIRSESRIPATGQNGSSRHVLALLGSSSSRINEQSSGLLIRGFGVQVPGGAPVLTWGFIKTRSSFSCPFCPHVCSMFARAHGPSNPGLVKNDPSGARCGGNRPGAAPSRTAGAVPGSLDQWSRPSRSGMRNAPGVPFRCRHIQ